LKVPLVTAPRSPETQLEVVCVVWQGPFCFQPVPPATRPRSRRRGGHPRLSSPPPPAGRRPRAVPCRQAALGQPFLGPERKKRCLCSSPLSWAPSPRPGAPTLWRVGPNTARRQKHGQTWALPEPFSAGDQHLGPSSEARQPPGYPMKAIPGRLSSGTKQLWNQQHHQGAGQQGPVDSAAESGKHGLW